MGGGRWPACLSRGFQTLDERKQDHLLFSQMSIELGGQAVEVSFQGHQGIAMAGAVGGLKVMEIRRLAARGHIVKVIGDGQFWKLVKSRRRR